MWDETQRSEALQMALVGMEVHPLRAAEDEKIISSLKLLIGVLVTLANSVQRLRTLQTGVALSNLARQRTVLPCELALWAMETHGTSIYGLMRTLTFISKDWRRILNEQPMLARALDKALLAWEDLHQN